MTTEQEKINKLYYKLIRENCQGCVNSWCSQKDHVCLDSDWCTALYTIAEKIYFNDSEAIGLTENKENDHSGNSNRG